MIAAEATGESLAVLVSAGVAISAGVVVVAGGATTVEEGVLLSALDVRDHFGGGVVVGVG